ncbi:hypothetical protein [Mycobacteroides abscessus]|uniref:hypothetical protein n=1 Tax=Mycobacteroides abscessus TaxID=36809 RepID=UPI0009A753F4|nr:hypothetical protein [Mycobacteroides abscessus]SLH89266.1 Uncharacterised protein [Mycobacteroides abscessus subsp. abscessus]
MIGPLYVMRDILADLRERFAREMPDQILKEAAYAVVDELDRRLRKLTDMFPADTKMTKSLVMDHGEEALYLGPFAAKVVNQLADLIGECGNTLEAQAQPILRFVARIESEGYAVDGTDVTDTGERSAYDLNSPQVQVQFEAENIARAEQAKVYQQRLERMEAAIQVTRDDYARRIRQLPHTVHIPPPPPAPPLPPPKEWTAGLSPEVIHALKTGELPPET